jgi:hypothetical protein
MSRPDGTREEGAYSPKVDPRSLVHNPCDSASRSMKTQIGRFLSPARCRVFHDLRVLMTSTSPRRFGLIGGADPLPVAALPPLLAVAPVCRRLALGASCAPLPAIAAVVGA